MKLSNSHEVSSSTFAADYDGKVPQHLSMEPFVINAGPKKSRRGRKRTNIKKLGSASMHASEHSSSSLESSFSSLYDVIAGDTPERFMCIDKSEEKHGKRSSRGKRKSEGSSGGWGECHPRLMLLALSLDNY